MAHILVIDDDPHHRGMLEQLLRLDRHEVRSLDNGELAVPTCRSRCPDLVIVDVLMPVRDGIDTLIDLRRAFPALRLLAVSGGRRTLSPSFNLESAALVGADATLAKPFTRAELQAEVQRLLPVA